MKKILFLNKAPPYRHTGAEQVVWQLAIHLADYGWDVHFLAPLDAQKPDITNITFHGVPTPGSFFMEKAMFFLRGVPEYHRVIQELNPNIVYDNASPFPFPYAYLVNGGQVITKVHAVYGLTALWNKNHPITKLGTITGEQFYRVMDGSQMVAISKSTKNNLASLVNRNPNRITVINNGIDLSKFIYSFNPVGPVLTLCELTPRKNIEMLLRAWKKIEKANITNRRLIIAGDGPRKAALEKLTKQLNLNQVIFPGYVSESKKINLFRKSFCYVLPTKMEGFGLTNLEAMASGCVVVSTDVPGVQDYLIDGENGYSVSSDSITELADRLQSLLKAPKEAESIAKRGQKTAENYDVKKTVKQERNFLESKIEECTQNSSKCGGV